jgi:hypothetical protein
MATRNYPIILLFLFLVVLLVLPCWSSAAKGDLVSRNKISELDFITPSLSLLDQVLTQPNCLPELKPVPLAPSLLAPILDQVKAAFEDNFNRNKYTGAVIEVLHELFVLSPS